MIVNLHTSKISTMLSHMTSKHPSHFSLLTLIGLWLATMSWHLARIAIIRPAYVRMGDTAPLVASFAVVYVTGGWLRWSVVGDIPVPVMLLSLLLQASLIFLCVERPNRSSSLGATLMGVSAVFDFVIATMVYVEIIPLRYWLYFPLEITWMVLCAVRFFSSPESVQDRGYKPKPFIKKPL
jgi:hypothetical protein